jgi:hypothetical protein
MQACGACEAAHGGGAVPLAYLRAKDFASISSAHCKPSSMPTLDFSNFFQEWTVGEHGPAWLRSKLSPARTSSFTDPIGSTATAVSLYYTPSATGSKVPDFMTGSSMVPRSKVTSVTSTPFRSQSAVVTVFSSSSSSLSTTSSGSAVGTGGRNGSSSTISISTGGVAQRTGGPAFIGLLGAAGSVAAL